MSSRKVAKRSKRKKLSPAKQSTQDWPGSKVVKRKVSALVPYVNNARTHTKAQVAKIAKSIEEFGWTNPVLIDESGGIIAGHGRVLAAELLEIETVPAMVAAGWSEAQKKAYVIADNQLAIDAGWDIEVLTAELRDLEALDFDLTLTGFGDKELQGLLFDDDASAFAAADAQALPDVEKVVISKIGDLWLLGGHRLLCGDSTRVDDVARLMKRTLDPQEIVAEVGCVFADPPYGMGKEAEGILNDNLYREKLDAFQMDWWKVAREHMTPNGSLYVWGNGLDLWRLWYTGGLALDDALTFRNEIVWNKGGGFGMNSDVAHSYSVSTERCLFLMLGQQFIGNQNKDQYWEGWEPLRKWLLKERKRAGWKVTDINKITGTAMAGHWFGKSQFQPITEEHYESLRKEANGAAFIESYKELFEDVFADVFSGGANYRREIGKKMREDRTTFNNTHEIMHEVWDFPRVHGEDRFGHATPKPVAMIGRALKTSLDAGGVVFDPFSGTGTVLIAAELLDRVCCAMELEPAYVDVAIRRWQEQSGEPAVLQRKNGTRGKTFAALENGGKR